MEPLPVTLKAAGEERAHVGKFPGKVSLAAWGGMGVARCVDAKAEELVAAPVPEALRDEDPAKRTAALAELARSQLLLSGPEGEAYCGTPLPNAGNFVLLQRSRDGRSYTLTVVREWFEFSKRSAFKAMNIEEAEAHLKELQRKSVIQATVINRKMASDKIAAEAAVIDAKRAIAAAKEGADDGQAVGGGGGDKEEAGEDNIDYEFECSDDDESAAVMVLATDENKALKKKEGGGGGGDEEDEALENPLEVKKLTAEEKVERRLKELQKEYDEAERREREAEEAATAAAEASAPKREREEDATTAGVPTGEGAQKKAKKVATVARPLTEEEVVSVLQNDPNVTLQKLIGLFKTSFGTDPAKKSHFMKLIAKLAVTKTVDGNKVLRLRERNE